MPMRLQVPVVMLGLALMSCATRTAAVGGGPPVGGTSEPVIAAEAEAVSRGVFARCVGTKAYDGKVHCAWTSSWVDFGEAAQGDVPGTTLHVENRSERAVELNGESSRIPFLKYQRDRDGAWADIPIKWCGNTFLTSPPVLGPGDSLEVSIPLPADAVRFRVAVQVRSDHSVAWEDVWTDSVDVLRQSK